MKFVRHLSLIEQNCYCMEFAESLQHTNKISIVCSLYAWEMLKTYHS